MRSVCLMILFLALGCSGGADADARPAGAPPSTEAAAAPQAPAAVPGQEVVQRYTEMLYRGETDLLFEKFSPEMKGTLPLDQLSTLYEQILTRYGTETRVIDRDAKVRGEYRGFVRWAEFDKTDEIIEVQWILREDDTIAGLFVRPAQRKIEDEATVAPTP